MTDNGITVGDWGTIRITRFYYADNPNHFVGDWSKSQSMPYTKYTIKESDMRVKTASFVSPNYVDLTIGQYAIRIISKYHENFAGVILDVDYDEDTGLYTYQCQDFSRLYISKFEAIWDKMKVYECLMQLICRGQINTKKFSRKGFKDILSGLRPLKMYDQSLYPNQHYKGNPFKQNISLISRDKSWIEVIRSIVYGSLGFFDVWFNDKGILQIEPLSKTDWENTGLHLSSTEYANRKFKFSTTNAITGVVVNGSDAKYGKSYTAKDLTKLDLKAFFGNVATSISDPVQKSATKKTSNAVKNKNNTASVNKDNPYGTKKKVVYMNIDVIEDDGHSEQDRMNKMCDLLKKHGWECHTCGVGSESHYQRRGEVYNGIWFTLYGGACAGTLRETAKNDWYRKPLVNHGSRTVVGFFPPAGDIRKGGKYYSWLPRAHDDGFSGDFSGVSYPAKMLTDCAIPFMYAKNPSEMVNKFLKGGDNPEACTKNWKFYSR